MGIKTNIRAIRSAYNMCKKSQSNSIFWTSYITVKFCSFVVVSFLDLCKSLEIFARFRKLSEFMRINYVSSEIIRKPRFQMMSGGIEVNSLKFT